jgi:t-SNARE complex subunit (syntaxin)
MDSAKKYQKSAGKKIIIILAILLAIVGIILLIMGLLHKLWYTFVF